jgi:pantoate--beta-alanine ligase
VSEIEVISDATQMVSVSTAWKNSGHSVAMVPTMGSLHAGHRALVTQARHLADRVVVTIFVNPLQFGEGEDFDRYPRGLERDLEFLRGLGVDAVFSPDVASMYPEGLNQQPLISAGKVGELFEGADRPGHFDGVLTVVARLCELVNPDVAVFGKKDAQQLFVISQMFSERSLPITVHEVDTVRDADGLALSSRNVYLSATERELALSIPGALHQAATASSPEDALASATATLRGTQGITVDYVALVDPDTFLPLGDGAHATEALLIVAATIGGTRLIDNQLLAFHQ